MVNCTGGKQSWPELVGADGQVAAAIIEKENNELDARVVEEGSFVNGDFRCDRVRVWVDRNGIVIAVPKIG